MKLSIFDKQIIHIKKSNDMHRKRIRVFNGVSPGKIDAGFRFINNLTGRRRIPDCRLTILHNYL